MTSSARFSILMAILFWLPVQAEGGLPETAPTLSLPVVETEEIVKNWLTHNGYHPIYDYKRKNDRVVEAWRDGRPWRITLSAHTPLATRIQLAASGAAFPNEAASLLKHLRGYAHHGAPKRVIDPIEMPQEVKGYLEAVVCIYALEKDEPVQLSGFCLDREGIILTTGHGLRSGQRVRVELFDGRSRIGRVVKLDAKCDLSLIKVPEKLPVAIPLRNGRFALRLDERLFAVGCPRGKPATITLGRIDGPPRRVEGLPLWQASIRIEPGSSGSPVLDERGRLAGVIKGRYRGTDVVGFLIPFETLLYFMEKY